MVTAREFDYVVIGAGSAGCAVATRLSENPDTTVLLLEAGGWDTQPEIHRVDCASVLSLLGPDLARRIDWGYQTEPDPGLDNRKVAVARGRVVGGCSAVNALMWVWGGRADFDRWHDLGNRGWSYAEVEPYFRRAESFDGATGTGGDGGAHRDSGAHRGGPGVRGADGPISVRRLERPSPVARAFVDATGELGYGPADQDYNGARQEGFGFFYQTTRTRDGQRCSTATGYLHPAADRPNLTIEVGALAQHLDLTGDEVTGVTYVQDGQPRSVRVGAEVIVSAGAFETPKLLMLSGIGAASHLARHGIRCRSDLPGVGRDLQDHLFVPVCYAATVEHPADALLAEAGLFTRTAHQGSGGSPDLQFTFGPVTFAPAGAPEAYRSGPGFTFAPIGISPRSRGEVTLRDDDPRSPAVVRAGYLTEAVDLEVLLDGVKLALELAHTRAFDPFRGPELGPGGSTRSDDDLRAFVRANATTLWHPVGTCRMGDDPHAVVDDQLRVHGVGRLRIADASIMPEITAGNTNAPSVMIGEKAADLVRHGARHDIEEMAAR